jgi:hypothetical protein
VKREFKQTPFDEEFRKNVLNLLNMAKKEVLVITGEGGSYQYLDLRWALEEARERGVSIKIYCVRPPVEYVNKILQLGCEVYVGKEELEEHYLIVDREHGMTSAMRAGAEVGKRAGEVRLNDKAFAKGKARLFDELVSKAKRERKIKREADPLWKLIKEPLDFGFDTHSERFEEEL